MICKKCKGTGVLNKSYKVMIEEDSELYMMTKICDRCLGYCELDWIENVTGKIGMVPKSDSFHKFADIVSHSSTTFHKKLK